MRAAFDIFARSARVLDQTFASGNRWGNVCESRTQTKSWQVFRRRRLGTRCWSRNTCARTLMAVFAAMLVCAPIIADPALSQGFKWPWENDEPPRRPPPRQQQPRAGPEPHVRGGEQGGWTARTSVCLDLERRLVQQSASGGQTRSRLPQLENQIRTVRSALSKAEAKLDRSDCYDEFLFTRTLRQTPRCTRIARQRNQRRRQLARLEAERQELTSQSSHSYQDEIIRELARNNCGSDYVREANRRQRNAFTPFWEDQDDGGSGYANSYQRLPFATYRTLCVRLCDGFYFPVSFSTLPNHFERDAEVCQSRCAAPASLYYHQNPGAGVEEMVSFSTSEPYKNLGEAFLYRKKYVDGCSCKSAEYIPQTPIPGAPVPATPPASGDRAEADKPARLSPYR